MPESTTTKNQPPTADSIAAAPVVLDANHQQQLAALANMSEKDLINALEAKNLDTTGNRQTLLQRLQTACLEEAQAATEPPVEERKSSPTEDDDVDSDSDDGGPPSLVQQVASSSSSSSDGSSVDS
jgi:hypothetical protein